MTTIAILLPDLRGGGAERVNLDLAYGFQNAGYRVEFVLLKRRGEFLQEAEGHFSVVELQVDRLRHLPFALARYLREADPEVILAAMWPLTGIASIVSLCSKNSRVVLVSEHVDFRTTPSLKRLERSLLKYFGQLIYRRADWIIGVSAGVVDSLVAAARLSRRKTRVIYNPLRLAPVRAATMPTWASPWLKAETRLIAVGSFKRQKRFDVLLKALNEYNLRHPPAHLLILGDGDERATLQGIVDTLQLTHCVSMPGFQDNVQSFMALADCFVLSSDWEGFGNVIVEAMSVGCPVVSTDCPSGPSEILECGRYGVLVAPSDPAALAEGIDLALGRPRNSDDLKDRASHFDRRLIAQQYLDLIESILPNEAVS